MCKTKKDHCVAMADVIATWKGRIVLIERLKFPFGLALPGGHVEKGERPRATAIRECKEETGLTLRDVKRVDRRAGKRRDPRYSMSKTTVYSGVAKGVPKEEHGRTKIVLLTSAEIENLPSTRFACDHGNILMRFLSAEKKNK